MLGCLFVLFAATVPRLGFLIIWAFTNWVQMAFKGAWLWPLLGVIFAPFTALTFVLVSLPAGGINLGGWLLVGVAVLADIAHWALVIANRQNATALYDQYSPTGSHV
jgi:hypothetical protein